MKKTILSIAVVIATMIVFSASATTISDKNNEEKTESQSKRDKKKKPEINPFAGIELTDQQQSELNALKPTKDNEAKPDKKMKREEIMKQMIENRLNYLEKVKGILTTDQYVQFLENNYVNSIVMNPQGERPRRDRNMQRPPRPQGGGFSDFEW